MKNTIITTLAVLGGMPIEIKPNYIVATFSGTIPTEVIAFLTGFAGATIRNDSASTVFDIRGIKVRVF